MPESKSGALPLGDIPMQEYQKYSKTKFSLCAVTVDLFNGKYSFENLENFCKQIGIDFKVANSDIENIVFNIRNKGCMSCMACKLKGKASNICKFKDALTPVLEEIAEADGLVAVGALFQPMFLGVE